MRAEWEAFHTYHVEHIIARQHGGQSDLSNRALACHFCNFRKGPNLTSIDPDSSETTRLFHPRRDLWSEHFEVIGARIIGKTSVGGTTVFLLDTNDDERTDLREVNLAEF